MRLFPPDLQQIVCCCFCRCREACRQVVVICFCCSKVSARQLLAVYFLVNCAPQPGC